MAFKAVSVVSVIASVVEDVRKKFPEVYYSHSRINELGTVVKSMMSVNKKVFPLIYLVEDIEMSTGSEDSTTSVSLTIYFATTTKLKIRSEERTKEVIEPILVPIYEEFINALCRNRSIRNEYKMLWPSHKAVNIPFAEGDALFVDKSLDAIKVSDLKLKFINSQC